MPRSTRGIRSGPYSAAVTRDDVLLIYIRGPRRGEVHLLCSDYLDAKEEATEQDVQGAIRFVARTFGEFLDGLYEAD